MKTNFYLLKVTLVLKLLMLGFNVGIFHHCGKIFDGTENEETLCKECKTRTLNNNSKPYPFLARKHQFKGAALSKLDSPSRFPMEQTNRVWATNLAKKLLHVNFVAT